jgi:hypothetical protein
VLKFKNKFGSLRVNFLEPSGPAQDLLYHFLSKNEIFPQKSTRIQFLLYPKHIDLQLPKKKNPVNAVRELSQYNVTFTRNNALVEVKLSH